MGDFTPQNIQDSIELSSFSFQTQGKAAKRDKAPNKMYEPCHRNIEDREIQIHHDVTH